MGFRRRFALRLAARTAVLLVATALTAWLAVWGRAPTAMLIAAGFAIVAAVAIWRLVDESNAELARFVVALDRADLSQSFARAGRGAGFEQVGAAYERALSRLRGERAEDAEAARFAEALVDGAPVALLVIGDDEVAFVNKAARRLFGRTAPCRIDALASFGPPFVAALRQAAPGPTRLSHLIADGLSQRVALDTTLMEGGGAIRRIVAIKIIQAELDGAELAAQIDLVRVLTHEIMNSLTPVTSLAATAMQVTAKLDASLVPNIADAQLATAALARRAAELERFIESYKGFSEAPAIRREPISVGEWLEEVMRLFAATPLADRTKTDLAAAPDIPVLHGDKPLLTQVLLNLLKNAAEAAADEPSPAIMLSAVRSAQGGVKITVADNGPGIPPSLMQEVFLPFFTTKRTGTGIGLSFARQIVLLHGGQIGVCGEGRGCLELLF